MSDFDLPGINIKYFVMQRKEEYKDTLAYLDKEKRR